MSSKLRQRCTTGLTCLAILILIAIITTVWVMLSYGAFHKPSRKSSGVQDNLTLGATIKQQEQHQQQRHKEYIDRSHLDDGNNDGQIDFVKPLKSSPLPLHDHDRIYDQLHNNHEIPPLRHHSGHFRHSQAEVWDPHPQYEIVAFGQKLLLELKQDDRIVAPDLHITHVWDNYAHRIKHDPRSSGCIYTGKIKGDNNSDVVVSLCNGMTGYIRTSVANYYIEPAEKLLNVGNSLDSFLHRIKKIPHQSITTIENNEVIDNNDNQNNHCETSDHIATPTSNIIEDELEEEIVQMPPPTTIKQQTPSNNNNNNTQYRRRKREIIVDYFDIIEDIPTKFNDNNNNDDDDYYYDYSNGGGSDNDEIRKRKVRDTEESLPPPFIQRKPYEYNDDNHNNNDDDDDGYDQINFFAHNNNNNNDIKQTNEYFMKVMVVADRAMVNYHQTDEKLRNYILILMSHAALLFKDATIGNSISLSVVDIWILKNRDFSTTNSQVMLKEFCEWQHRSRHNKNYDTALLLTRHTVCKNSSNCNTLGVAQMGTICDTSSSCSIVKDIGLSSSYTIAHELGHVLNIPHDDNENCDNFHGSVKQKNVMSRMFQNGTKPWMWSKCSRHFATEFLESGKAKCLSEPPSRNFITSTFVSILPGETIEVDRQCELQFGPGFRICSYMQNCENLWCTSGRGETEGCKSQYSPWAEGTRCGNRHWCHHGKCIPMDRDKLTPIAGGWSRWHDWGPCSRTCGGGIKISKRSCDNPVPENGGPYCVGKSVRYASCNTEACENETNDFRELQCAQFNGKTMNIPNLTETVEWVPKYGLKDYESCQLHCRPKNSNAYYQLRDKVIDGTKCDLNTFDICVNGICRHGGCDNRLDSKLELDECGVCGGNNSQCEEITGTYNLSTYGYNKIIRFPKGSSNLDIRQKGHNDGNYLALVDGETGQYILNGNYTISNYKKDIIFGTVIIKYTGSSGDIERITTLKNRKLTKDLVLEVLSWGELIPPDITYRYVINRQNAPKYDWRLYRKKWSKCSSICSGIQYMYPICVELISGEEKPENYCSELEKQHQTQKQDCNQHCQLLWNVAMKGPCSVDCGKGIRNIHYNCIKIDTINKDDYSTYILTNNYGSIVDDKHCTNIRKPPNTEQCYQQCNTTHWEYSQWSECTKTCGNGIQWRSAKCIDNLTNQSTDDSHCQNREKIIEQICNTQKCPVWSSTDWTPCSKTCGRGFRTKPYYCQLDGRIYNPSACDPKQIHIEKEECNLRPCSGWSTGVWSECSQTCSNDNQNNNSIQTRNVICEDLDNHQQLQDDYCRDYLKPNTTRLCQNLPPCTSNEIIDNSINYDRRYRWITGAWSQCSKSCNTGISSRMVVCRDDYGNENEHLCNPKLRPIATIECNPQACWYSSEWSSCDLNCEKHRQIFCRTQNGTYTDQTRCDLNNKPSKTMKCKISECLQVRNTLPKDYMNSTDILREKRYRWKTGRWHPCNNNCGKGIRTRQIQCEDTLNHIQLVDQYCNHLKKPKSMKPCEKYSCSYTWIEGDWSTCSQTCGQGYKTRPVTCHKVHQNGIIDPNPLPDLLSNKLHHRKYCDLYKKPITSTNCQMAYCSDIYIWRTSEWRQCSQACGKKGRQLRQLFCIDKRTNERVPKHYCRKDLRPVRKRKCNQWRCLYRNCKEIKQNMKTKKNQDYLITINGRTALIYCYKMDTNEPEEFISLRSDWENFSEYYQKRLKNPDSCPFNGQRPENCGSDCLDIGQDRAGSTRFWKVRLNVTSLKIINDDFTFSTSSGDKRVPYGTAGDCYSAKQGCIQGRFSIDLSDTMFRIVDNVRWHNIGTSATSQINMRDRRVYGRCGGYCGDCLPDPDIGLQVEIT